MPVPYHETSLHPHPPPPTPSPSKWGPYSGAGDFSANMIVILAVLFCALILALTLNAIVRYLLCARRHSSATDPEKPALNKASAPSPEMVPTLVFTAGTKLADTLADCAICLVEFADGDRVRVLPACNHGFHVGCIEKWLRAKSSCPTCRSSIQVAAGPTSSA